RICAEHPGGIAGALPRIVDVHVNVACVLHSRRYQRISGLLHIALVHIATEVVPAIPAHRRSLRHSMGSLRLHRKLGGDDKTYSRKCRSTQEMENAHEKPASSENDFSGILTSRANFSNREHLGPGQRVPTR